MRDSNLQMAALATAFTPSLLRNFYLRGCGTSGNGLLAFRFARVAAETNLVPTPLPLFSPIERPLAKQTHLMR